MAVTIIMESFSPCGVVHYPLGKGIGAVTIQPIAHISQDVRWRGTDQDVTCCNNNCCAKAGTSDMYVRHTMFASIDRNFPVAMPFHGRHENSVVNIIHHNKRSEEHTSELQS